MNAIGLVIGKLEAEKQGVVTPDSTRIGVVAAMMPNPLMSLIVGRKMGEKQAPVDRVTGTPAGTGTTIDNSAVALTTAREAQATANEAKTAADAAKVAADASKVSSDEAKAAAVRTEEAIGKLVKRFEVVEKKVDDLTRPPTIAAPKK